MTKSKEIQVQGIPRYIPEAIAGRCRSQLEEAVSELLRQTGLKRISLLVESGRPSGGPSGRGDGRVPPGPVGEDLSVEERALQYTSRPPQYGFDFLVLPEEVRESLLSAVDLLKFEEQVFGIWNLKSIEPFPRTALNFHGPPGTGKTLAAHAVADYLKLPILVASYAQVESKYVGDGPKNVEAVFYAAQRDGALLFIDEADSLLSRRLTHVNQGAEQAINSMRSQLLICLEQFRGIVIFSTNLVENYDRAFETRMRHIHFPLPDRNSRQEIWSRHLPRELPLAPDVSPQELSKINDICGRDIKNAVIEAALRAARSGKEQICARDLVEAVQRIKSSRIFPSLSQPQPEPEEGASGPTST